MPKQKHEPFIRPPQLPDGEYFIGRFMVRVAGEHADITPRQHYSHRHQPIDNLRITNFRGDIGYVGMQLYSGNASGEAEQRILKMLRSKRWAPRKVKVR